MLSKKVLVMDGKTFNECWSVEDLVIKNQDNVIVKFFNDTIVNVKVNEKNHFCKLFKIKSE